LQCSQCVTNDVRKCLNLTEELYDHLLADATCTLHWFCNGCENAVMGRDNPPFCRIVAKVQIFHTSISGTIVPEIDVYQSSPYWYTV